MARRRTFRTFSFAGPKGQRYSPKKQTAFLNAVKENRFDHKSSLGKDIKVEEDGKIAISNGRVKKFVPTLQGFESLCGRLGIPDPFAKRIPKDLLLQNIGRLLQENGTQPFIFSLRHDDKAVVSVTHSISPIPSHDLVSSLLTPKRFDLLDGWVGDDGVSVAIRDTELADIVIGGNDVSWGGLSVTNSESGLLPLAGRFNVYRNECTNSAILPANFMVVRRNANRKLSPERTLANFLTEITSFASAFDQLKAAYLGMPGRQLTDAEMWGIWQAVQRILGDETQTDKVFRFQEPPRKLLKNTVEGRKRRNRENIFDQEPAEKYDANLYDVMNTVTKAAHTRVKEFEMSFRQRRQMEQLGGRLVMTALTEVK